MEVDIQKLFIVNCFEYHTIIICDMWSITFDNVKLSIPNCGD